MPISENKRIQGLVKTTAEFATDDFVGRHGYDTTEQAMRIRTPAGVQYAAMRQDLSGKADIVGGYLSQSQQGLIRATSTLTIVSRTVTAPPGGATEGQAWIVPSGATGAWSGRTNEVAVRLSGTWQYITPYEGLSYWDVAADQQVRYDGATWVAVTGNDNGDINLMDRIPVALHAAIRAYTSTTDVSAIVQQACDDARDRGVGVYVPGGRYFLASTVDISCPRFYGPGFRHTTSGPGVEIRFAPPSGQPDLTACIHVIHPRAVVEGINVFTSGSYGIADMATWCDESLLPSYSAFVPGLAAIRIGASSQAVLRRIKASGKVGLLLDAEDGHISVYDSSLSGMFGVYQRISSGDMFFQGCGINGTFAGIIFGDLLYAGHYGGMQGCLFRCHMGFSPWGVYQVRDNSTDTSGLSTVSGWAGSWIETSWEQIGECAMELLPNSATDLNIVGGSQGWASIASFKVPTAIRADRMKYWFRFGQVEFFDSTWALQSSGREFYIPSPYADNLATAKAAYVHKLGVRSIRSNWDTLGGSVDIGPGGIDRQTANPQYFRGFRRLREEEVQVRDSILPVGNLINNPETPANWTGNSAFGTGGSITSGAWSTFPELASVPPPIQMVEELGPDPIVTKFVAGSGAGVDCGATIDVTPGTNAVGRRKFFTIWATCPGATGRNLRTSLIDAGGNRILDVARGIGTTEWTKHEAYDGSPDFVPVSFGCGFHNSASQPTYIAGAMVSLGRLRPYTPHSRQANLIGVIGEDRQVVRIGTNGTLTSESGLSTDQFNGRTVNLFVGDGIQATTAAVRVSSPDGNNAALVLRSGANSRWAVKKGTDNAFEIEGFSPAGGYENSPLVVQPGPTGEVAFPVAGRAFRLASLAGTGSGIALSSPTGVLSALRDSFSNRRTAAAIMATGFVVWRRQRNTASWSTGTGDPRSLFEVPAAECLFPANTLKAGDCLVWESDFVRIAGSDIMGISRGATTDWSVVNTLASIPFVSGSQVVKLRIEARIHTVGASGVIQTAGYVTVGSTTYTVQVSNMETGQPIDTTVNNYLDIGVDPSGVQNYGGYMGSLTYYPVL